MQIRWTEPAVADLTAICDYLDRVAGSAIGAKTARAIYDAIESLQPFPNKGRIGRIAGTRELTVVGLPYIVLYEVIQDEAVLILAIRHGAQRWPQA